MVKSVCSECDRAILSCVPFTELDQLLTLPTLIIGTDHTRQPINAALVFSKVCGAVCVAARLSSYSHNRILW